MPRLLKAFLLSLPLAWLFNALLWFLVFLVSWNFREEAVEFFLGVLSLKVKSANDLFWPAMFWLPAFLQACLVLLPLPAPSESTGKSAALWVRVIAAAFLGGLLIAIPCFALIDLLHLLLFSPQVPLGLIRMLLGQFALLAVLGIWAVSWLVWIPLLMRRARREADALERFVVKSAKVSAVGLALCLPLYYVIRKNGLFMFTQGSFWALVLGLWSLLVVGGPLLLVLARDRRLRAGVRAD